MAELSKTSNIKAVPMGSVVIREGGASPKEMILLLQGNVGVYKNYKMPDEVLLNVISQGSFHGELSLFLSQEQSETLVALTNVVVMTIDRRNIKDFLSSKPDMAINIVEGICKKLSEAVLLLNKLKGDTQTQAPSRKSSLFPEGHGSYTLPLTNMQTEFLYLTKTICPLCGYTFDNLAVLQSKLRMDRIDPDLRTRYKDFEPLFYEIITCPNCFFSADNEAFEGVSKRYANGVNQVVGPYKLEMYLRTGMGRDTFTVFAGYYLALLCAAVAFDDYQMVTANLWLKLSRLYHDCDDGALYLYASERALADYRYAYENFNISEKQLQQTCYLIGDLHCRLGDVDAARNFFFMAKTSKAAVNMLKRQADIRLEEIRELKKHEKEHEKE